MSARARQKKGRTALDSHDLVEGELVPRPEEDPPPASPAAASPPANGNGYHALSEGELLAFATVSRQPRRVWVEFNDWRFWVDYDRGCLTMEFVERYSREDSWSGPQTLQFLKEVLLDWQLAGPKRDEAGNVLTHPDGTPVMEKLPVGEATFQQQRIDFLFALRIKIMEDLVPPEVRDSASTS